METRTSVIKKRLEDVSKIIPVASAKGGVGKSIISSNLALNLKDRGYKTGLLDLDFYGPSSHIILGLNDYDFPEEENGILPPRIKNIKFMSIVHFTKDRPSAFRGADVTNIIKEILAITQWGNLDYLIIDMPPGIGEETLDLIRYIERGEFLVVSTPSKVAINPVKKLLKILKELDLSILGVIGNMERGDNGLIQQKTSDLNIKYLGSIKFDKNLEKAIGSPSSLLESKFMDDLDQILDKELLSV